MYPVWLSDHLVGKEGAGCFVLLWFVVCVLFVVVCSVTDGLYSVNMALLGHWYTTTGSKSFNLGSSFVIT